MSDAEPIHDSPTGWVADHIRRYVATDGQDGHVWQGKKTLLLTTRGRKSGKLYRTALIYGMDNEHYVVVASRGGHSQHPAWYHNLVADPAVQVQVAAERFKAQAASASGAERERLWALMVALWPTYQSFQNKTKREIPVVVLTREAE